jgi:hypothetical protein
LIPDAGNMARPNPREAAQLFDLSPTNLKVTFPTPRHTLADVLDPTVFDREIDPEKYYPADLYRKPEPNFPAGFTIDVGQIAAAKLHHIQEKLAAKQDQLQNVVDAIEQAQQAEQAATKQ